MILVLDASMALAWMFERLDVVQRDCADRAVLALTSVAGLVPSLWHVEVANALLDLALRTMGTLATFDGKLADAARNAGVPLFE